MTLSLKPIDTPYKGHLFRSRLEARWAVFFDALELEWEYESEGYDLDGIWYLPDFKVMTPQGSVMWIEVKPAQVTEDRKFAAFAAALQQQSDDWARVYLVSGTPLQMLKSDSSVHCPRCGGYVSQANHYDYVYCGPCDFETPSGGDNPSQSDGLLGCSYWPHKGTIATSQHDWHHLQALLTEAATRAQQARFEHGQMPRP
jgi:ribosomal protein S27AE